MTDQDTIFERLKASSNLPSMPQVMIQLIDSCHDPEVTLQEIAHIVDKDTALSAKMLQLVNSAFIGARKTLTSIEQTVVYLGADTVRNLAISLSVQQVFRNVQTDGQLSMDRFWYHSLTSALLARNLAQMTGYKDSSEAYLTGLLHDIGKLLLWVSFPDEYAPLLHKGIRCNNGRMAFLEEDKLQINHCTAGAWLCVQWHLPASIAEAIASHHLPLETVQSRTLLTKIIYLTDLLSHSVEQGQDCLGQAAALVNLSAEQVAALFTNLDLQIEEIANQFGITIPQDTDTPSQLDNTAHQELAQASEALQDKIRDLTQLAGTLDNLLQAEDEAQIIQTMYRSLKILFNINAAILLIYDSSTGILLHSPSQETPLSDEAEEFMFPLENHPDCMPARALYQEKILFSSREETSALTVIDKQLLHFLQAKELAAMPISYDNQDLGVLLIGLDNTHLPLYLAGETPPIALLCRYAAISLYLRSLYAIQIERRAAEKVETAVLTARKIAHEINNPLGILRNYLAVIKKKCASGEGVEEEVDILDKELERIGIITTGLDNLNHERRDVHPDQVDLLLLIEESVHLYRTSMLGHQLISLNFIRPKDSIYLFTDADYLRQIIQNLLSNAVDALHNQGIITVRVEKQPELALITIEDDGPGIPPELRPHLFEEGISSKAGTHGGLGLAIAQRLASRIGGQISCASVSDPTMFSLSLPL